MIGVLIVSSLLDSLGADPAPLDCRFPPSEGDLTAIRITVTGAAGFDDLPGVNRVGMSINDSPDLPGAAGPISTTPGQDVMIRAVDGANTFFTVGVDFKGRAALNVLWPTTDEGPPREITRTGTCENHERFIEQWTQG